MTQPTSSQPAQPATSPSASLAPETETLPLDQSPAGERKSWVGVALGEPLTVCGFCYAIVPAWAVDRHEVWHVELARRITHGIGYPVA